MIEEKAKLNMRLICKTNKNGTDENAKQV